MVYPVTLSILTWKAPVTLQRTLASLTPILPLFAERLVICQEGDAAEIALAQQFGFRPVVTECNVGIQNGLKLAVSSAANEFALVLENDAEYLGGENGVAALNEALTRITTTDLDHVRLGLLDHPNRHYVSFWGHALPPKRRFLGFLRRRLADLHLFQMLWFPESELLARVRGFVKVSDSLWLTDSSFVRWNNRSFLTRKSFFLGKLIPFAEARPTSRLVNGYPDLEHPINCRKNRNWWPRQRFRVGILRPGLFGHVRHDRPGNDQKRAENRTDEPAACRTT
jgi:hypothetical protein